MEWIFVSWCQTVAIPTGEFTGDDLVRFLAHRYTLAIVASAERGGGAVVILLSLSLFCGVCGCIWGSLVLKCVWYREGSEVRNAEADDVEYISISL